MNSPYVTASPCDGAVALLILESGLRRNAMTISFFSEVAHYPTCLWISVATDSFSHQLLQESGRFSLAVLHDLQKDWALLCGSVSGRDRDKCEALPLYRGQDDFLYLTGALANIACRVRSTEPLDTHTIYIADILSAERDSKSSLRRHLLLSDISPHPWTPIASPRV